MTLNMILLQNLLIGIDSSTHGHFYEFFESVEDSFKGVENYLCSSRLYINAQGLSSRTCA